MAAVTTSTGGGNTDPTDQPDPESIETKGGPPRPGTTDDRDGPQAGQSLGAAGAQGSGSKRLTKEDLEKMKVEDLTELADQRGVEIKSGSRKSDIIGALMDAEQGKRDADKGALLPMGTPEARQALQQAGFTGADIREVQATKAALDAMPKEPIWIPQRQKDPLPDVTVQINDYTYRVPRGQQVMVPAEVARIIRDAGYLDLPG